MSSCAWRTQYENNDTTSGAKPQGIYATRSYPLKTRGPPEGDPRSPAVLNNSTLGLLPVFLIAALIILLILLCLVLVLVLILALALLPLLAVFALTVLTVLGHAAHLPSAH
ncbi:hypothetical protein OBV_16170 [Oscillibacter valericigenes Sjm18-20]|nr:hypothetical protein OBV_16170 [Oscillibacter valericigenes Sjm18-20]